MVDLAYEDNAAELPYRVYREVISDTQLQLCRSMLVSGIGMNVDEVFSLHLEAAEVVSYSQVFGNTLIGYYKDIHDS